MKPENLISETLREWAEEARVPPDLAGRALRGRVRRRVRTGAMAAAAAACVVAVGVVAPGLVADRLPGDRSAVLTDPTASTTPGPLEVSADPEGSPPRTFVAAGRMAMSAYYTWKEVEIAERSTRREETWFLYDARTGGYVKTPWGRVGVARGMRHAVVLEREQPARRLGILDMATHEVVRWVDLEKPVSYVTWSPDGTKVLATAYERDPTIRENVSEDGTSSSIPSPGRNGFYVVDGATGEASYHAVSATDAMKGPGTEPFRWSEDGTRISGSCCDSPEYYDLDGKPAGAPERRVETFQQAGISPDGRLYAADGAPPGPQTTVRDVQTGKIVGTQPMLQLMAWADDSHLIALGCAGTCENEFTNGLVVVSVDGKEVARLTGDRDNSQRAGNWVPVLTPR
ncbi:hypothetical protein [Sphaerisporangium sp. TRM90804]|uniref:hypothetical protein n=1 Tax=Sphaerisporangium sp. TRM90804 TaxID=3031113 RepID=UPI002447C864|nr:hypothetical protein [Sphaerisporangium sp. TRM90804]MDH2428760.1 hypothetical protein [Sphaerisporangium sp. TRM90804]